ncbi:MAG: polyphenol oxidase family protein [Candidatus Jorgensenbacteria bacterium]|nr:polyphenol oxidase family protein [Candidatus Jorgensenbacteria bacterium]
MYQLKQLKNFTELVHGASTREEGNMSFRWGKEGDVLKNREKFLNRLGISLDNCVNLSLQHGTEVVRVSNGDKGKGMYGQDGVFGDTLITKEKGLFLFLVTADCLPVIFYDRKNGIVALCHAGWKGADKKIVQKVAEVFIKDYGSEPANIYVGIGPAIHSESYKFLDPVQKKLPSWAEFIENLPDGQTTVDLVGYAVRQLTDAKVLEENIMVSEIDTVVSPNFFSHRRSVKTGEPEGRFATIVGIR